MALRWLITGAGGMVASDLRDELAARGEETIALTQSDLDITDQRAVMSEIGEIGPDIIINCAAFTRVDDAEEQQSLANAINGSAVEMLAQAANASGSLLVQISTDFVFDGAKRTPYEVNDPTNPQSSYARSKLLGEFAARHAERHLIVRTSWLFGVNGHNFVEAIRGQIAKGVDPLRVVDDQRGRPTYTRHLAEAMIRLARLDARGVVHYADEPDCTWHDFAVAIAEHLGSPARILPVSTDEFPRPAKRPAYSVLSTERYERLTGVKPESWRDGLREYFERRP